MNLEKLMNNLRLRRFETKYFDTGAEARAYLAGEIRDTAVGIGGSKTAEQLGLYEALQEHNTVYWHWRVPGKETRDLANAAPVYIASANAISEDGEIVNIDGTGNRVAAMAYGEKKLYIVAGTNKVCPDFDAALHRARNVAAVQNAQRFPVKTPCKIDGTCHDCRAEGRICHALLVLWGPVNGMDVEVILVGEELGM